MKLQFEPNLDYQLQAVEAVCGLFHGQETCRTEFTVTRDAASGQMGLFENDLGIGNRLTLLDDELLDNDDGEPGMLTVSALSDAALDIDLVLIVKEACRSAAIWFTLWKRMALAVAMAQMPESDVRNRFRSVMRSYWSDPSPLGQRPRPRKRWL